MQPIQPDQAVFLLNGVYLPGLKNEQRITKSVIEAIPADKGDYRPDEISKSALELAWHIVVTEMRFMEAVAAGEFDFSPRPLPDSVKTSGDLAGWYTENFGTRFEGLTKLSSEQLLKVIDFRGMFQLPAVTYLTFLLHHSIHHRGPVVDVSAADGREGSFDLRRELRRRRGSQGVAEGLASRFLKLTNIWENRSLTVAALIGVGAAGAIPGNSEASGRGVSDRQPGRTDADV